MSMTVIVYAVPGSNADRLASNSDFAAELTRDNNPAAVSASLEKAWHGLHYLLTGDAWESARHPNRGAASSGNQTAGG